MSLSESVEIDQSFRFEGDLGGAEGRKGGGWETLVVGVKSGIVVRRDCCSSCIQAGSDTDGLGLLLAVDNGGAVECAVE